MRVGRQGEVRVKVQVRRRRSRANQRSTRGDRGDSGVRRAHLARREVFMREVGPCEQYAVVKHRGLGMLHTAHLVVRRRVVV